jgi:AraC-like DNA-binding protein
MLTATSDTRFGETRVASALVLAARFRAQLVWRHHLLFDSRFVVPARGARDLATLYLVHEGEVAVGDVVHQAPVAFVIAAREYERYETGAPYVRSWGDPCVALDLQLATADLRVPVGLEAGPVAITPETWAAVAAIAESLVMEQPVAPAMQEVLRNLAAAGVVSPALATEEANQPDPPSLVRMWEAIAPFHSRWDTSLELVDLAETAMLSSRQLSRDAQVLFDRFGFDSPKFRDVVVLYRLRLAALLLSARGTTVGEVATQVGYGSVDALGRAFRDAGLPPPRELRELVMSPT